MEVSYKTGNIIIVLLHTYVTVLTSEIQWQIYRHNFYSETCTCIAIAIAIWIIMCILYSEWFASALYSYCMWQQLFNIWQLAL